MMTPGRLALVALCAATLSSSAVLWAQGAVSDGVRYAADGTVVRPTDYREWVYLSSGLGMTYGPAAQAQAPNRPPDFDNVFVNRDSYRAFLKTGKWPDKTMFILEVREAVENVSINNGGRTQGGIAVMEAAVKDQTRFAATNGWGYFDFGRGQSLAQTAAPLPSTARCYQCHKANTAVEQTFVQFYPELMEVARRLGTVRPDYDPTRKP